MRTSRHRLTVLLTALLCACATPTSGPETAPRAAPVRGVPDASATPDPARVYADLLGKTEDLPRVARSPREYEGRSIVLYGLRNGDLRPIEGRYSMPLASTDGRPVIAAIERPANNQLYLLLTDGILPVLIQTRSPHASTNSRGRRFDHEIAPMTSEEPSWLTTPPKIFVL
jgi:hypothetical protein